MGATVTLLRHQKYSHSLSTMKGARELETGGGEVSRLTMSSPIGL